MFEVKGKQKLPAIMGLLFCLSLLVLSFPRLIAAFYLFYPAQITEQFNKSSASVDLEHYIKSDEYIERSLRWSETGTSWQALAINKVRQIPFLDAVSQHQILQVIDKANSNSLALSPVNPYAWFRLAVIEKSRNAEPIKVINALRLSCFAERVQQSLLLKRVKLLFSYQKILDDEMLAILYDQIYLASQLQFNGLVKLIKKSPDLLPLVEVALQHDLEHWNKLLKRL